MKNVLKISFIVFALLTSITINAQKIAHINLDSLISIMPESKTAQQAVQDYAKQLEVMVTTMQTELQTKYDAYQKEMASLAPIVKETKEKELNDLNQRIQDFQQQAQQDYQKKTAELSKPVYEKAKKAIEQVSKENGYKYALDTSTGIVIYFEPTEDIIALVIKKLGIVAPAAGTITPPKK